MSVKINNRRFRVPKGKREDSLIPSAEFLMMNRIVQNYRDIEINIEIAYMIIYDYYEFLLFIHTNHLSF